jgi:hypothetical protein
MIDVEKIIADTVNVFTKSLVQRNKISSLKDFVDHDTYKNLHRNFLTPLDIKIDCDDFIKEIKRYNQYFQPWGKTHTHLPRMGLALVNQDGMLKDRDPINGSLYEWNNKNPNSPIFESDCTVPTEVLDLKSLEPLRIFDELWFRSNILKWHDGAEFLPHIDTVIPSPWLRLWGTTSDLYLRYWNKEERDVFQIEKGRIYLIDTSLVHSAQSFVDHNYQFFLSVSPLASDKIRDLILDQ